MASAQAPAQLKSRLWADASQQVYALVMGSRVPDLPKRLAEAEVMDYDCLLPGALDPVQALNAPYLVQLRNESAFTDWLLFEAGASLGDWGVIGVSGAPRLALRTHWRGLLQATLPEGQTIALEWMDPEILWALLPLFDASGLARFFGPVTTLVQPGAQAWRHARLESNLLQQVDIPLARAA